MLAQLRAKGFRSLAVELEAPRSAGHTLRVACLDDRRELLVELRAERSRGAVPGMEVISVDWLLLQNPRERFSPRRPQLPGQQHPGLGLLRDFMGWLVVVCEAHELDGVFFVAAHYHIAMQSRRLVRPLRPEDEARLAALSQAARRPCRCRRRRPPSSPGACSMPGAARRPSGCRSPPCCRCRTGCARS